MGPRVGLDVAEKTKVSAAENVTVFPTFPVRSLSIYRINPAGLDDLHTKRSSIQSDISQMSY